MSVRKIRPNRRSVTGWIPSGKNESGGCVFESALERDFATLLEFDPTVEWYDGQPLRIPFEYPAGTSRTYTPDFLVRYNGGRVILAEVKYRSELFAKIATYHPIFRAACRYAKESGFKFRIVTEVEIRTALLRNAQFLLPFRRHAINSQLAATLLELLRRQDETENR